MLTSTLPRLHGVVVLLVEREPGELLTLLLTQSGAIVASTRSAGEALQQWDVVRPDVLITDAVMTDDGVHVIQRALEANVPSIAITGPGHADEDAEILLIRAIATLAGRRARSKVGPPRSASE